MFHSTQDAKAATTIPIINEISVRNICSRHRVFRKIICVQEFKIGLLCVFDEKMEASEKSVCARGLNKGYWENKYLFDKEIIRNIDLSEILCSKKRQTLLENCKKVAPGKKNR